MRASVVEFVPELLRTQLGRGGPRVAVGTGEGRLTFAELSVRVERFADRLVAAGIGPGEVVGVRLPRGDRLIVAMLGVLRARAAFLLLDPALPEARAERMLIMAGSRVLVTMGAAPGSLEVNGSRDDTVRPDRPDGLAYVVFTSGSTGEPKPVAVSHRALANHASALIDRYGLGAGDRVLQFATPGFDVVVEEVIPTLLAGARVVPLPPDALAIRDCVAVLERAGVTVANLPTPYWAQWVRDLDAGQAEVPSELRLLVVGSSAGNSETLERWRRHSSVPVINAYGLSETTITVATARFTADSKVTTPVLPIGRPIGGCDVRVLDAELGQVPDGEIGELYIGGAVLSDGYLGRPALTADRFVPDPHGHGGRLLRTGDLVRAGEHGLEFTGRADRQLKIRGQRVEPVEVETALTGHPAVSQAYVCARAGADGAGDSMVAYIVPAGSRSVPDAGMLRAHLRERLPAAMIPATFAILDSLPTGPTGKVDERALPAHHVVGAVRDITPPRTEDERRLVAIWEEVTGRTPIGIDDDLFDIGGHSLTAVRIAGRVREGFGVALPVGDILAASTVAALAPLLRTPPPPDTVALPPLTGAPANLPDGPAPLSLQQEQVWFHTRLAPSSIAYHTLTSIRVLGPLDLDVLDRVLTEMNRRHEILRITYGEVDGRPHQTVHRPGPVVAARVDLSGLAEEDRGAAVDDVIDRELRTPFDLSRLPLLRWTAVTLAPAEHELVLVEHHLVHDGWSFALLMRDLTALYEAYAAGRESPLADPPIGYRDYALWQRSAMTSYGMRARYEHWTAALAGLPPALTLPYDRPRPAVQTHRGALLRVELPGALPEALRRLARAERTTLFSVMYAGFIAVLHRYTAERDVCVGSAFANRLEPMTHELLGMLVNPVLLRCAVTGEESFRDLVTRAGRVVLDAGRNQELPFPALVRALNPGRDPATNPLVQVLFSANDSPLPEMRLGPDTTATIFERGNRSAKVDLNVVVVPRAESQVTGADGIDDRILLMWEYNADLFREDTVRRLADAYLRLLADATRDPDRCVRSLAVAGDADRDRALRVFGRGGEAHPARPVHLVVAERARRSPDAVAVDGPDGRLTYGDLLRRGGGVVRDLRGRGAALPENLIGVCLPRGGDLVVAAFGVLSAGAAYLPLDPDHPPERLARLCADAGVRTVISAGSAAARLPDTVDVLRLDRLADDGHRLADDGAPETPAECDGGRLAYVVYTSGSTGAPKGVLVEHAALANLTGWHLANTKLTSGDHTTLLASPAFDASVWEMWPALVAGSTLHVPDPYLRYAPADLARWLVERGITVMFAPTVLAEALLEQHWPADGPLRLLLTGGDRLRGRPADMSFELVNNYGPTENAVVASAGVVAPVDADGKPPSIGRPIDGVEVLLLDPDLEPVPLGAAGEIYLGGAGLARGYLARPGQTADRFVPHPYAIRPGMRLYRTGDLGRHLPDGRIEFLGRADRQVQVRGYRVEPGEVTAALLRHPGLRDAHVAARRDARGSTELVGYVVPVRTSEPDASELRGHLAAELPAYMVPGSFVVLDALPQTSNGKIDESALPDPVPALPARRPAARASRTEELIAGIWSEVLGRDDVGVTDNFFDLGGHSLLLGEVHARLAATSGIADLPLVRLFQLPTVRALAEYLDGGPEVAPVTETGDRRRSALTRLARHRSARAAGPSGTEEDR